MASPVQALKPVSLAPSPPVHSGKFVRVRRPANAEGTTEDAHEDARPWAKKYADYAALAAMVYHRPGPDLTPYGWTCKEKINDPETSLYLEAWDNRSLKKVALVFRGTSDWKDWWSNARFVTRYLPLGWDQYPLVRDRIDGLVERGLRRLPDATIVTVGHSLGGGLAQQAAYAHPAIKSVVAFDPSPLTGFRDIPEPERARNSSGIKIERVYEKGEILAYLRGPLRKWVPLSFQDPSIVEVRFDIAKGRAVQEHSMHDLAQGLADLAR